MKKINKINGVNIEEYHAEIFEDYKQVVPTAVKVGDDVVAKGGRNVILTNAPLYLNDKVKPILESFDKSKLPL